MWQTSWLALFVGCAGPGVNKALICQELSSLAAPGLSEPPFLAPLPLGFEMPLSPGWWQRGQK